MLVEHEETHDREGVDRTLIREALAKSPETRLRELVAFLNSWPQVRRGRSETR